MKRGKFLAALLLMAFVLILTACGSSDSTESGNANEGSGEAGKDEVTGMLEQVEDNLYLYTVDNGTDETMNFEFTSGQRFDFTLSNDAGDEVYRMSSVSMFMQAIGEETLEPGSQLEYEFEIPAADLEPGNYLLKAWLTPKDGEAYEAETEITVE